MPPTTHPWLWVPSSSREKSHPLGICNRFRFQLAYLGVSHQGSPMVPTPARASSSKAQSQAVFALFIETGLLYPRLTLTLWSLLHLEYTSHCTGQGWKLYTGLGACQANTVPSELHPLASPTPPVVPEQIFKLVSQCLVVSALILDLQF